MLAKIYNRIQKIRQSIKRNKFLKFLILGSAAAFTLAGGNPLVFQLVMALAGTTSQIKESQNYFYKDDNQTELDIEKVVIATGLFLLYGFCFALGAHAYYRVDPKLITAGEKLATNGFFTKFLSKTPPVGLVFGPINKPAFIGENLFTLNSLNKTQLELFKQLIESGEMPALDPAFVAFLISNSSKILDPTLGSGLSGNNWKL